jgi:hypothetical protein
LAHGKILSHLKCFESGETITPIGLLSVSNRELLFGLDDVMAGIGIECKQNLPDGRIRRWTVIPGFPHAALDTTACAALVRESRMKCINVNQLHKKSGGTTNAVRSIVTEHNVVVTWIARVISSPLPGC